MTLHSDDIAFGSEAFSGCKKLANKQKQVIVANILFDCFSNKKNLVIPEGVTALGDGALASCDNLESVTIPESVTAIGPRSFPSDITLKNRFTIHSPAGSYAEQYAKESNIPFVAE